MGQGGGIRIRGMAGDEGRNQGGTCGQRKVGTKAVRGGGWEGKVREWGRRWEEGKIWGKGGGGLETWGVGGSSGGRGDAGAMGAGDFEQWGGGVGGGGGRVAGIRGNAMR